MIRCNNPECSANRADHFDGNNHHCKECEKGKYQQYCTVHKGYRCFTHKCFINQREEERRKSGQPSQLKNKKRQSNVTPSLQQTGSHASSSGDQAVIQVSNHNMYTNLSNLSTSSDLDYQPKAMVPTVLPFQTTHQIELVNTQQSRTCIDGFHIRDDIVHTTRQNKRAREESSNHSDGSKSLFQDQSMPSCDIGAYSKPVETVQHEVSFFLEMKYKIYQVKKKKKDMSEVYVHDKINTSIKNVTSRFTYKKEKRFDEMNRVDTPLLLDLVEEPMKGGNNSPFLFLNDEQHSTDTDLLEFFDQVMNNIEETSQINTKNTTKISVYSSVTFPLVKNTIVCKYACEMKKDPMARGNSIIGLNFVNISKDITIIFKLNGLNVSVKSGNTGHIPLGRIYLKKMGQVDEKSLGRPLEEEQPFEIGDVLTIERSYGEPVTIELSAKNAL